MSDEMLQEAIEKGYPIRTYSSYSSGMNGHMLAIDTDFYLDLWSKENRVWFSSKEQHFIVVPRKNKKQVKSIQDSLKKGDYYIVIK